MPSKYFVERTYQGVKAVGLTGREVGPEISHTFNYALGSYGFLLPLNKRLSGAEWIALINTHYDPTPRHSAVIRAIEKVLPE